LGPGVDAACAGNPVGLVDQDQRVGPRCPAHDFQQARHPGKEKQKRF